MDTGSIHSIKTRNTKRHLLNEQGSINCAPKKESAKEQGSLLLVNKQYGWYIIWSHIWLYH